MRPGTESSIGPTRLEASSGVVIPWLIRLRWVSLAALGVAAWAAAAFWRVRLPLPPLLALLAAMAATNVALSSQLRSADPRRAVIGGALGSRVGQKLAQTILGAVDGLFNPRAEGQAQASGASSSTEDAAPDLLSQLERLGQLKTQGLLTEEEFAAAKAQLLNG